MKVQNTERLVYEHSFRKPKRNILSGGENFACLLEPLDLAELN